MKLNGLEQFFKTGEKGEIVDFNQIDRNNNYSPLMYTFYYNKTKNLNLISEQLDYLIKNSDLNQVNNYGESSLIFALRYNKEEDLKLNSEQFYYLIKHSDLKQIDYNGWTLLRFALAQNQQKNLNLNNKHWKYLIEHSDLSLITEEIHLIELKKIQLELFNEEILSKIDIQEKNRINKI